MKQSLLSPQGWSRPVSRWLILLVTFVATAQMSYAQLSATVSSTTDVSCNGGSDGAIDISVSGGVTPYTYSWSSGQSTEDISGISAGSYTVTVTDALMMTTTASATITEPAVLSSGKVVQDVTCNGGTNGAIYLNVSGGTAPYTYLWNTGATTDDITNMPSGPYNCTITDSRGCNLTVIDTIGEPSQFMLIAPSSTNVSCNGGSDGSTSVTPVGGILPYTYLWSNGATTKNLTNVPAGTYTLTASDNNGCKDVQVFTITEPSQGVSATYTVVNTSCYNDPQGSIDLTVSGGVSPYTFVWSNGATTEDLDSIPAGNYSVTISDANGCPFVANPTVAANDTINPTAVCQNISAYLDGTGNLSITAAMIDNGSSDNCNLDTLLLSQYNFSCTDIGAQTVILHAYDSNGNSDSCVATVTVIDTVSPNTITQDITVYLVGTGTASINASAIDNGSNDACGIASLSLDKSTFDCSDLGVTVVNLTATDASGNQSTAPANVTVVDSIYPNAQTQDITVSLDLNGQHSITVNDLDNGSADVCGIDTMYLDRYDFTCADIGAQNVVLTVVDQNGNTTTDTAVVTVQDNTPPTINVVNPTIYLDASGNASINVNDVTSSVTDACGLDTVTLDNYSFGCPEVGTNTVVITATDLYGNTANANATVTVVDTNAPEVHARDLTVYLDASGNASILVSDVDSSSNALCGLDTLYLDQYNFVCADVGVQQVILTGETVNGVLASDTADVTVMDTISPSISTQNISVYLDANGQVSITADDVRNSANDACGIDTLILDNYSFGCAEVGNNTVSLTAFDVNGNSRSAQATVSVTDTISPTIVPRNITVYLNAMGTANITGPDVVDTLYDNCGVMMMMLSKSSFGCADTGVQSIQMMAVDFNGNNSVDSTLVTVVDTINPTVLANDINVYLDVNGQASITAVDLDGGSATACGMDTLYISQYDFDCSNLGANSVILTAIKDNGQSASDTGIVTVIDTLGPTITPQNINVYLDANGQAAIVLEDIDSNITDACGLDTAYLSQYNFSCMHAGANSVTVFASDINGNNATATATVTVIDSIAPQFSVSDITVYLDASGLANIAVSDVSSPAWDTCGVDTVTLDQYVFDCSETGVNVVTVSATDVNANVNSQTVNVTVLDTIAPVVTTVDIDLYLDASGLGNITPAHVLDSLHEVCGIDTMSISQSAFDCSMLGANSVNLTVADASGNSAMASAIVRVYDTVAPSVSAANVDLYLDTAGTVSIYDLSTSLYVYEACALDTVYFSQDSFSCPDLGVNRIGITALDMEGNMMTDSLTVTVRDTTPPVLVNQNITVYLDSSGNASISTADVNTLSKDVCGIDTLYLDRYNFTCADVGSNTVTLTAVDLNGTAGSAPATVMVMDTIQPVVSAQNITIYSDANGLAVIKVSDIDQGSFDNNCSYSLNISDSIFDCSELGLNLESLTITDGGGNSQSVDFFVTVIDTISPIMQLKDVTVSLNANGVGNLTADQFDSASTDNCANLLSFTAAQTSFSCADLGTNTVMVTANDGKMNSSSTMGTVHVIDPIAPVVITQNATIYLDANGQASLLPSSVDNGSNDNCALDTLWLSQANFTAADLGQSTVKLYAADMAGNQAWSNLVVTLLDTSAPVIASQSVNLYLDANGQAQFNGAALNVAATDNDGIASINVPNASFSCADLGSNAVTVTATDHSGNSASASLSINVLDTIAPQVSANNAVLYLDAMGNASLTAADVDNNSSDNCAIQNLSLSQWTFGCADIGTQTLSLSANDASGNSASASFSVTVMDTLAPSLLNVPANITTAADANCGAQVNFSLPAVSDNCGNATLVSSHQSGDFFPLGTTVVSFNVQDAAGNTDQASFTITVEDQSAPVVNSVPADDTVGGCRALYVFALPMATDNCSNVSVSQIAGIPSGGFYPIGSTTNSFMISDAAGNDTVVSFTVTVMPVGQPTLPNELNVCENDSPLDFSNGQNLSWSGKGMMNSTTFDPSAAGTGRHVLTYNFVDDYGCVSTGTISITVSPIPTQPSINRIASNTLSTGAYDTYQWYRDGVAIPGATKQSFAYTQGGNYQVLVTNSASCENHSDGYVVGAANGGIGIEEKLLSALNIYPNPSQGQVTIDLDNLARKELSVSLFSITGKLLFEQNKQTASDGKMSLDLSNLPKATYILRVSSEGEIVVRQIVLY